MVPFSLAAKHLIGIKSSLILTKALTFRGRPLNITLPIIALLFTSTTLHASVDNQTPIAPSVLATSNQQASTNAERNNGERKANSTLLQPSLIGLFGRQDTNYAAQRQTYLEAQNLVYKNNQATHLLALKNSLEGYPLKPYLDYHLLSKKLGALPYTEVDKFLDENTNSYLGDRLLRNWLLTLERKQHWHDFQSYYRANLEQTDLHCHFLKARLLTGDESALNDIDVLWNVGHSQPKACDTVFKLWQAAGRQTAEITWSRATQALEVNNRNLARYITKYAEPSVKKKLDLLLEVDRYPEHMDQARRFSEQTSEMQFTILHGIKRLARKDSVKALQLWERYDAQHLFNDAERIKTQELLIAYLSRQDHVEQANALAHSMNNYSNVDMISGLIRDALENLEWSNAEEWIRRLPNEEQNTPRWRYWSTRIAEVQGHSMPPFPSIEASYKSLATERTFYGFLAANRMGLPYQLEDQPSKVTLTDQQLVANSPSILRAKELFAINQIGLARQEWRYAANQFSASQLKAAGTLAANWGWHRGGIQAMIDAQSWNDLTIRFPFAYETEVMAAAQDQEIDANLLFAIARQESAFSPDAKSPAGALGLMQLMPATAKQTARKAGMTYRKQDLLTPEVNVALGSRYLNEMLFRFNGNAAFAAAAYNAGPHRVDQWLSKGRDQLPLDVWIETIPFKETRGYVQNVMVFSVIYAYRNGETEKAAFGVTLEKAKTQQVKTSNSHQGSSVTRGTSAY